MSERDKKFENFVREDKENNRGRIVNSCAEINYLITHPDIVDIYSKHCLNDILTYATMHSKFYKEYRAYKKLEDFPIVNKQILKDCWDEIVVKDYIDCSDNKMKYTSGSTGTPFKLVLDRNRHSRWIAGNKVFREIVGVKSHEKTIFISENVMDKNIPIERQEKDNVYYLDYRYFDNDNINNLIKYLADNEIKSMTILASALERIAQSIIGGKICEWTGSLIAIFTMSDNLKESTRKIASDYFQCPVYNMYGNEECGVIASEDGSQNGCLVNTADLYLEVLSLNDDMPAREGEIGRLVITDYFNRAFPIIRYENGDLVSIKKAGNGKLYITTIAGRKSDMLYTTDGCPVFYFNCISFLEPYSDIKQFQLIQEDYHNFTWVLNTKNHEYEEMIVAYCKSLFGEDSYWKFNYVDEIPKLRSGKFQMTVCKINK